MGVGVLFLNRATPFRSAAPFFLLVEQVFRFLRKVLRLLGLCRGRVGEMPALSCTLNMNIICSKGIMGSTIEKGYTLLILPEGSLVKLLIVRDGENLNCCRKLSSKSFFGLGTMIPFCTSSLLRTIEWDPITGNTESSPIGSCWGCLSLDTVTFSGHCGSDWPFPWV